MSYYQIIAARQVQAQQQQAQAPQPAQATVTHPGEAPQPYNGPTSPLPQENPAYVRQGNTIYVNKNYDSTRIETYQRTPRGPQTIEVLGYQLTPKPQLPTALEAAKQQADIQEDAQLRANTRQGTQVPGASIALITQNLNPQERAAFNEYQTGKATGAMANLGIFFVSALPAPFLGPAGAITTQAAKTVATQAVVGGGLSLGFSQGVKAAQGGGLLTPSEAAVSFGAGAIIAPLGAKTNAILGLTGKGVASAAGRTAVNAGLGGAVSAGAEYVQTGKVTPEGVAVGAATGAAFSGLTEVAGKINTRYGVTEKAQGKLQDTMVNRNMGTLEQINDKYVYAYNANEMYQPTLKEKMVMKATDLSPLKPSPQILEAPTVPTANPANFETYMGTKEVTTNYPVANRAGKVVDMVPIKESVETPYIREKPASDVLSYRGILEENLRQKTIVSTDIADAGTVIYGRSESPEVYYSKAPAKPQSFELPTYELTPDGTALREVPISHDPLSFSKSPAERRMDQVRLRENTLTDLTNNADLFPEIPKSDMATSEATAIQQARRNSKTASAEQVMKELNNEWLTQKNQTNAPVMVSDRNNALIQEMTQGKAASPTGIERTISDIQAGRTVETARAQTANPFTTYSGPAYYKQRSRQTEELEQSYYSYPDSGLAHPNTVSPMSNVAPVAGVKAMGLQKVGQSPKDVSLTAPRLTANIPTLDNDIGQPIEPRISSVQVPELSNVTVPDVWQPTRQDIVTTPTTPPPIFDVPLTRLETPFMPEFKFEGNGLNLPAMKGYGRSSKRIRYYPVVDPENMFGALF